MIDLVIVGAGPAGLACAVAAQKAGLSYLLVDKGTIVDAIRRFPNELVFFSTSELLEVGDVPFLTGGFRPTRVELLRYYQKVAEVHGLNLKLYTKVNALRKLEDGFVVETDYENLRTRRVVIATGYFDTPAPFDLPGANLPKVKRYYDEPYAYYGLDVAVVGGSNSAVEVALDLYRHGSRVTLIHRGSTLSDRIKYWVRPDIENRIARGEITALFETVLEEIRPDAVVTRGKHSGEIKNDGVFVMIGYHPENKLLEAVGAAIDQESLAPVHNSQTFETSVRGLYVAGSSVAGKFNNKIFIENGRRHGKQIVEAILRDN